LARYISCGQAWRPGWEDTRAYDVCIHFQLVFRDTGTFFRSTMSFVLGLIMSSPDSSLFCVCWQPEYEKTAVSGQSPRRMRRPTGLLYNSRSAHTCMTSSSSVYVAAPHSACGMSDGVRTASVLRGRKLELPAAASLRIQRSVGESAECWCCYCFRKGWSGMARTIRGNGAGISLTW